MLSISRARAIYVHPGATDMRYGIKGLVELSGYPKEGELHVFCSWDRRKVKMVVAEEGCILLLEKRLTAGRFPWPSKGSISAVDAVQLVMLLDGATIGQRIESGGRIPQVRP